MAEFINDTKLDSWRKFILNPSFLGQNYKVDPRLEGVRVRPGDLIIFHPCLLHRGGAHFETLAPKCLVCPTPVRPRDGRGQVFSGSTILRRLLLCGHERMHGHLGRRDP